jgi:DNA-binding winged helix-turn-helix (wHTH) protein/tetratricopeptide (TPR) repeat protein
MGYRIGEFELDTRRELLLGPSGPVPLRRLLYHLLLLLARRAPAVVGHDELLDALWGPQALSPGVVPQTVSELRRALGDDPRRPRLIATRHRRGYALIAPVQQTDDAPEPAGPARGRGRTPVRLLPMKLPPAWPAMLDAVAASGAGWAVRWPAEPRPAGEATWALEVVGRRWRLAPSDDTPVTTGTLRQATLLGQLGEVLAAWGERSGYGPLGWPEGWGAVAEAPAEAGDPAALCRACAAAAHGDHGLALRHFGRLAEADHGGPLQGWPRYWLALALAGAGRRTAARALATGLEASADPVLSLRAEALHADLGGQRDEALSALRAAALLAPEDLLLGLAVLDAQLEQGQWVAAATQLTRLRPRASAAVLGWRETALTAATRPEQALSTWAAAEQAAGQAAAAADAEAHAAAARRLERLQVQRIRWLLERGEVGAAAAALAEAGAAGSGEREALAARCLLEQGQAVPARGRFETAAGLLLQAGWTGPARRARAGALDAQLRSGDAQGALAGVEALAAEVAAEDDPPMDVELLILAGRCHAALHHPEDAERRLEQAVTEARQRGLVRLAASARHHLGSALALQRRQPERAEALFRRAAEGFRDAADALGEVRAQANLALMAERAGRRLDARQAYRDALRLLQPLQAHQEHGRVAYNAGVNERDLGDLVAAAAAFDLALSQLAPLPGGDLRTMAVATRADLALQMAEPAVAQGLLDAAAAAAAASGPIPRSCWHTARARLLDLAGDFAGADAELDAAEALRRSSGVRVSQIDLSLRRICLHLSAGNAAGEALLALERLEAELLRLGEAKYALTAGLLTACACHEAGEPDQAADKAGTVWQRAQRDGTRHQQLLADWVLALSAPARERERRWRALARDAAEGGFALMALLVRQRAAQAAGETAPALPGPLIGALRNAAGVF